MKIHIHYRYIISCFITCSLLFAICSPSIVAQDVLFDSTNTFEELDRIILNKKTYEEAKENKIKEAKINLQDAESELETYKAYNVLFNEYDSYRYDSAYAYSRRMHDFALKMKDDAKITESKIIMAYCNISAGLFLEAKDILDSIDYEKSENHIKILYNSMYAKLYLDNAAFIRVNPYFSEYNKLSIGYSEKVIAMMGDNQENIAPHQANIYKCQQKYDKAIRTLENYIDNSKLSERGRTLCIGGIGNLYLLEGDTTKAIPYLIYAAKSDVKSVIKETPALSILSHIAYRQDKIERAYLYAQCSLSDANIFNARHRKIEIGSILPIVEGSRFDLMENQKNNLLIYGVGSSILVILLITSIIYILKQIKQLKKARGLILQQNTILHEVNTKLKEVSKIKDEYIGHSFSVNSDLITEIDKFQKQISRKVASRQYNDILTAVKWFNVSKERENSLESFDRVFLKIFPEFVNQYNNLFENRDRAELEDNYILSPEMRIFALIRLGVNDSNKIAKMLNYSVHTINTYKTKVKNKSLIPNEQFEDEIMQISVGKIKKNEAKS